VTVPAVGVPPVTVFGERLTLEMVTGTGLIVSAAEAEELFALA